MNFKKLGIKISCIVTLIIIIMVLLIISTVSNGTYKLITQTISERSILAHNSLKWTVQDYQNQALSRAEMIASSSVVIDSILSSNIEQLEKSINTFSTGVDLITLCDANGTVLTRSHSDQKGDDVTNQKAISIALSTGKGISTIEKGTVIGLSTRGSAAIKDYDGNIIGALTCGHDLSKAIYVDNVKDQSGCETTLFADDERMNTTLTDDQGNRVIGTKANDNVVKTVLQDMQDYSGRIELFGHQYDVYYSPIIIDNVAKGMLFTGIQIDDILLHEKEITTNIIIFAIVSIIISIILLIVITNVWISIPLGKIKLFAEQIKDGAIGVNQSSDLKINVRSKDEAGQLARTLEDTCISLKGYIKEISERMHDLSTGDLTGESIYPFKGDFIVIKDSINNITANLNNTMANISASADQVATGSEQIASGAQTLAQSTTEQAVSVEKLSSSILDVSQKTIDSLEMIREATTLEDTIKANAEKGSAQMDNMIQSVKEINEASNSISKVMKTIDDIAFQTNILALNAAVEAARAGQHGKGFAVVAEEVRNLATKSSQAAKETAILITNTIEKAELGMDIASETSNSLADIVEGIIQSGKIINNIATSSEEQSTLIDSINISIEQVNQAIQQNSATAEESAAASTQMNEQINVLNHMTSQFKINNSNNINNQIYTTKSNNKPSNNILSLTDKY